MTSDDGEVLGLFEEHYVGHKSEKYNIVLVAEGYTEEEMDKFRDDVTYFKDVLFSTPPFDSLKCAINIYRLEVKSNQSGADDPLECLDGSTGSGDSVETYFDATFCGDSGTRRNIKLDEILVWATVDSYIREFHTIGVLVNSPKYGGGSNSGFRKYFTNWGNQCISNCS